MSDTTLDQYILYAARNNINTSKEDGNYYGLPYIKIGHFLFGCHSHYTGNHIVIFVHHGDGENYKIVDTSYWHDNKTYGFNADKWESGRWDNALREAIEKLKIDCDLHKIKLKEEAKLKNNQDLEKGKSIKQKFEEIFNND